MSGRVLIACVGNIFMRDDGFGAEVARRLAGMDLPDGVTVADYGTGGMHLAYDMADGYQATILVDAAPHGGQPGTLTVFEAAPAGHPDPMLFDGHGMQPDVVFGIIEMLGAKPGRILVVGCEPASTGYGMELSVPVAAAAGEAARIAIDLARTELARAGAGPAASVTAEER